MWKHGKLPDNQAKIVGTGGQKHVYFGSIKYPQTYLFLIIEQNKHKQLMDLCSNIQKFSIMHTLFLQRI